MIKKLAKYIVKKVSYISPELNSKIIYRIKTGKKLNLKSPKTFNEKLMFLKLYIYRNDSDVIRCSDKYEVRGYVKEHGLENILNEVYGVYDNSNEIEWDRLPSKFVLKCTHGCQYNILCTDKSKLNIKKTNRILNKWLKDKYGYNYSELHYLKIKPRIICEKFLETKSGKPIEDYKVYCFNGKAKIILVCTNRNGKESNKNFYDINWNKLDLRKDTVESDTIIQRPERLEDLIKYAEILTAPFPFTRADFYIIENKIYFGELTFTPAACCGKYTENADKILSDMLDIGGEF